jgi:hypothetical protein
MSAVVLVECEEHPAWGWSVYMGAPYNEVVGDVSLMDAVTSAVPIGMHH